MIPLAIIGKLYDRGFRGFPLAPNSKAPEQGISLSSDAYTRKDILGFAAGNRLGWHLSKSRLLVIDWDLGKDKVVDDAASAQLADNSTNQSTTPSGGVHFYYRITDWRNLLQFGNTHIPGLDVKFYGDSYVKCYGYHNYFRAQDISVSGIRDYLQRVYKIDLKPRPKRSVSSTELQDAESVAELWEEVQRIDPDIPYYEWGSVACALKSLLGEPLGAKMFLEWSARGDTYRGKVDTLSTYSAAKLFNGDARKFIINLGRRTIANNLTM